MDTEEIIEHQSASEEDGVQRRASGLVAVGTCVLVAQGASLGSSREVTACQSVGTGRNSRALGATPTTTTCSKDNWEQHTWERRDPRVPGHLVLGVLQVVPQAPDFGSVGQEAHASLGAGGKAPV